MNELTTMLSTILVCMCILVPLVLSFLIGNLIINHNTKKNRDHVDKYISQENYDKYFNK